MRKTMLKADATLTIGSDEDNPDYSLLLGHVDGKTFKAAFEKEGWDETDDVADDSIRHEYWVESFEKGKWSFKPSTRDNPEAIAVTVLGW